MTINIHQMFIQDVHNGVLRGHVATFWPIGSYENIITALRVEPRFRGRGIARGLLGNLIEMTPNRLIVRIEVDTSPGELMDRARLGRLFESAGFQPMDLAPATYMEWKR